MKTLITTLALAAFGFASLASADTVRLGKGDRELYLIDSVQTQVRTQTPHCPTGAVCETYSTAELIFTLGGCADRIGPVTATQTYDDNTGKIILNVTAVAIANKASMVIRCFRAPQAKVSVFLGLGYFSDEMLEVRMNSQSLNAVQF